MPASEATRPTTMSAKRRSPCSPQLRAKFREKLIGSQRFGEGRIDLVMIPGEENVTSASCLEGRRNKDMIETHLAAALQGAAAKRLAGLPGRGWK